MYKGMFGWVELIFEMEIGMSDFDSSYLVEEIFILILILETKWKCFNFLKPSPLFFVIFKFQFDSNPSHKPNMLGDKGYSNSNFDSNTVCKPNMLYRLLALCSLGLLCEQVALH